MRILFVRNFLSEVRRTGPHPLPASQHGTLKWEAGRGCGPVPRLSEAKV